MSQLERTSLIAQATALEGEKQQLEQRLQQELVERTNLIKLLEDRNTALMAEKASMALEKEKVDNMVTVSPT